MNIPIDYGITGLAMVLIIKEGAALIKYFATRKNGAKNNKDPRIDDIEETLKESTEIQRDTSELLRVHCELSKVDSERNERLLMKLIDKRP